MSIDIAVVFLILTLNKHLPLAEVKFIQPSTMMDHFAKIVDR